MKLKIHLIFSAIFSVFGLKLSAQTFDFICDTSSLYSNKQEWGHKMVDSLSLQENMTKDNQANFKSEDQIDFSKEDFEFRIFSNSEGLQGLDEDLFIMKHFIKENEWKSYYYHITLPSKNQVIGYKNKPNGEIEYYNSKKLNEIWKEFASIGVLHLTDPSHDTITKITCPNGISPMIFDCNSLILFKLIKKNCTHVFGFSPCLLFAFKELNKLPEYKRFKKILEVRDKVVNHEY